ncbi:MAG: response regulator [Gammaproteobacteria bacterium]|nr:response regulator [Anaerolineae bacterium]
MAINKVLIVDDAATDRAALQDVVASTNCTVVTASSGIEAVSKAKEEKPDMIFMDIVMGEMSGYDACRAIKEDPETANIPIVFVSSKQQKADHIWAKRQGGAALVGKPFTKEQIVEQMGKLG